MKAKVISRTRLTTRIRKIAKRLSRVHATPVIAFTDAHEGGVHLRTLDTMMNRENGCRGTFLYWNWAEDSPVDCKRNGWEKVPRRRLELVRKAEIVEIAE